MKLVGVENNLVNTDNSNEDFLIVSDQPIKKYSYYFELEAMTYFDMFKAFPSLIAAISAAVSIKNKGEASGVLGSKMPFARAIEHMHKPENCWKSLTPAYQIGA